MLSVYLVSTLVPTICTSNSRLVLTFILAKNQPERFALYVSTYTLHFGVLVDPLDVVGNVGVDAGQLGPGACDPPGNKANQGLAAGLKIYKVGWISHSHPTQALQ